MFETLKLYAIGALMLVLAGAGLYVLNLRDTVASQATQITDLKATGEALVAAQKALEAVTRQRTITGETLGNIRLEIDRAPEAAVPEPIARALDGLRGLQARPRSSAKPD